MCQAVSLALKSDGTVILPDPNEWNHSHSAIFERMGIIEGAITDSHARIEIVPKNFEPDRYRSDPTDEKLWKFILDEERVPTWFTEDAVALEDKCRREVARWMKKVKPGVAPYDVVTSGCAGTSISGYRGTSTSGNYGTSTSGYRGTSTSGDYGISTSGKNGTSISGYRGTAKSGIGGTLQIKYFNNSRYRIATAYVGENGIEPDVFYRVDNEGKFCRYE